MALELQFPTTALTEWFQVGALLREPGTNQPSWSWPLSANDIA